MAVYGFLPTHSKNLPTVPTARPTATPALLPDPRAHSERQSSWKMMKYRKIVSYILKGELGVCPDTFPPVGVSGAL